MPYRAGIVFRDFREKKPFEKMFGWVNPWDQRPQWIGLTPNGLLISPMDPKGFDPPPGKPRLSLESLLTAMQGTLAVPKDLFFFGHFP
jgi:hypothetical protein